MTSYQLCCGRVAFPDAACPCWDVVWRTHRHLRLTVLTSNGGAPGLPLPRPTSPELTPEVTMLLVLMAGSRDSGVEPGTVFSAPHVCVCVCVSMSVRVYLCSNVAPDPALSCLVLSCPL